jgi:Zn-dependent peptidase ImmA (M78 family)/transcriptional regulator with XRE-family HTH domain
MDTLTRLIGERIRLAREDSGLSQEALTKTLGYKDRQTLSTIECGQRRVSPEELLQFSDALGRPLDFFTDPYLVASPQALSYRAKEATPPQLGSFEAQAGRLIAAHRRFQELLGRPTSPVQPQISTLGERSPYDFAEFQGERCASAWQLGEVPALRLREAAKTLGIVVLHVDAPRAISGAACRLPDGAYVLINRNEPATRQNFDLGHEIFHLLTWDKLPPQKIDLIEPESPTRAGAKSKRRPAEILADSFTAGLLMPSAAVRARWARSDGLPLAQSLAQGAAHFVVSPTSFYWRLVNLGLLKPNADTTRLVGTLKSPATEERPQLYGADFVADLHAVLDRGAVTVRRVLSLLELEQDELHALFAAYKLPAPFDL